MTVPYNSLTPAEAERLARLSGEVGQVGHAISEILIHGVDHRKVNHEPVAICALEIKLGHLLAAMKHMVEHGDIDMRTIETAMIARAPALVIYSHHQNQEAA